MNIIAAILIYLRPQARRLHRSRYKEIIIYDVFWLENLPAMNFKKKKIFFSKIIIFALYGC